MIRVLIVHFTSHMLHLLSSSPLYVCFFHLLLFKARKVHGDIIISGYINALGNFSLIKQNTCSPNAASEATRTTRGMWVCKKLLKHRRMHRHRQAPTLFAVCRVFSDASVQIQPNKQNLHKLSVVIIGQRYYNYVAILFTQEKKYYWAK